MREPHKLEASKKTEVPRRMIFFDSESETSIAITDEEVARAERGEQVRKEHDPYLICATYYRDRTAERGKITETHKEYTGKSLTTDFWESVDGFANYGQRLYVFAHNAKYDVQVTAGEAIMVEQLGYTVTGFSDANPFILRLEKVVPYVRKDGTEGKKRKSIIVLSSTNYFQQSLKSLGETFNLPKLDFDHDRKIEPDNPVFMAEALVYARRDVEILRTAMLSFISFVQRENLGSFSMTVAGQAFAAYRQRFLKETIYIHSNRQALEVERRAYAGGRNECFSLGAVEGEIYYCDINSMYPHVMKSFLYPKRLLTFWKTCTVQRVKDAIMNDRLVCCDCLINTELPLFHVKRGKLIFPTGEYWTSLSTPEIIQALERGVLKEVKNVALYEPGNLFESYVDYFYNARLEARGRGDEIHSYLYKLFMNSLYGKFGQKNIHWEKVGEAPPSMVAVDTELDTRTRKRKTIKIFGGGVFEQNNNPDDMEAYNSFPAVAAHVTANARMLLLSFIELAGWENTHYCDTDSVFVNKVGYDRLTEAGMIDGKRLGALKLEESASDLFLNGCKDYTFHGKTKIKGVSKAAKPLPNSPEGRLRFAVPQWGGFTDRLRDGDFRTYYNKVIIKELNRQYDKGTIEENGRVTPFKLDYKLEAIEQAKKEMEAARAEAAAAAEKIDPIKDTILIHGYIRKPAKGERYYEEVAAIPMRARVKYFRNHTGLPLDVWCQAAGMDANTLLEVLR